MDAAERRWAKDNPDLLPLLRRCWDNDRRGRKADPADSAALAAWVTATILASPRSTPFDDWPVRFGHRSPHRDLSDLFPV